MEVLGHTNQGMLRIVEEIAQLPGNWHGAGCLSYDVIKEISHLGSANPFRFSVETGVGKSTLILSHCSERHVAFAADMGGDSLSKTESSHLLNKSRVEFVVGFSQQTVPAYRFPCQVDFALIDGAHGYPFPEIDYYFISPHLSTGAILVIDDLHIPTIQNMFQVLKQDAMFKLDKIVDTTAFLRRTEAPMSDPLGDGWYLQNYNRRYFPVPIVDSRGELVPHTRPDAPKPF